MTDYARQIDLYHPKTVSFARQIDLDYGALNALAAQVDLDYLAASVEFARQIDLDHEALDYYPLARQIDLVYLADAGAQAATVAYNIAVDGEQLASVTGLDFVFTRLTYKHSMTLTLVDPEDYGACAIGEGVDISLAGVEIPMIVTGRKRNRAIDGWTYTVTLESPVALLDYPFAAQQSGYLTGTASAIATTLAGTLALGWDTVNWPITGELLDASEKTKRELLTTLAEVPGGLLRSEFDGGIMVEPDYPVAVNLWATATPDYTVDMVTKCTGETAGSVTGKIYNAVYVGTSETDDSATTVSITTEDQDDGSVLVRVYTVPWDEDVTFDQTGGSAVSVERVGDVIADQEELVGVVDGEGKVSLPCYSLDSYSYQADGLGAVTMEEDGSFTTAVVDESLVNISYKSRSRNFIIRSTSGDDVLVVAESDDSTSDDTLLVFRSPADSYGEAIYDQLLTSQAVKRERGRNFIDASCSRRETVQVTVVFTELYRPGALVAVNDPEDGVWIGLLQEQSGSITMSGDELTITSTLTLEREEL
jgi:hypothetical protein